MRLLVATPTFYPIVGGAELLIDDIMRMLSIRHEARLLTPELPASSRPFWVESAGATALPYQVVRFRDRYNTLDIRGHKLTRGLIPPMSLSGVAAIDREVRSFRPDVLVTFFGVPLGLPSVLVKLRRRIPLVVVLCGTDVPSPRTRPVPVWRYYIRGVTAAADRAVYVSRFCYDALHGRSFDSAHDLVIHGGVDEERMRPADPNALRRRLGLAPDELMLFSLSRLGPEKRVDIVIHAFARVLRDHPRTHLVIGGLGSEYDSLTRLVDDLGIGASVTFAGYVDEEKADYFAASDIFVFHSMFETFGQVVAEAMTMGKPVVSVRAGAVSEVVDDGVTGLLSAPEDADGLAASIAALIDDPDRRLEMGRAGREKAKRCFDWKAQSIAWENALHFGQGAPGLVRTETPW